jgi:hypothetical protein
MVKRQIITAGLLLMTSALAGANAGVQASVNADGHAVTAEARAIEGVWEPTVTIRDCQTRAAIVSFASTDSYIRGGSYLGEGAGNGKPATGFGTWRHEGGRNFTALYQFFAYNPDGSPLGRLKVSTRIRLSADGASFRASDTAELTDFNGTVILQSCSTREARRFQ